MLTIVEEKNDFKLKGTKIANDGFIEGVNPALPNHWGFCMLLIGSAGSGKTSLLIQLLKQKDGYRHRFDRIYLYTGSRNTLPDDFLDRLNEDRIYDNLESLEDTVEECRGLTDEKCLFLFDDLVAELSDAKYRQILTKMAFNRRHMNISLCFITQKTNSIPTFLRSALDSIFFWNWNNKKETQTFFENFVSDYNKEEFGDIIKYIARESPRHTFLYINKFRGDWHKNFNKLTIE